MPLIGLRQVVRFDCKWMTGLWSVGEAHRSGRSVSQGAMWPDGVVVAPPFFDDDLGLFQGAEDLNVEEFVPEAGVEAFAVADFPG